MYFNLITPVGETTKCSNIRLISKILIIFLLDHLVLKSNFTP